MDRRIKRLELGYRVPSAPRVVLLWDDELEPCREHPACAVEKASEAHHGNVIRLRFGEDHA